MKNIIITGVAGFIGFHLAKKLLELGFKILGIDNLNNYYDQSLKINRLERLSTYKNFLFYKADITSKPYLENYFPNVQSEIIIHLAAEPGVRASRSNPEVYLNSNIIGFLNILDLAKKHKIKNLIFASSSSVYGNNPCPFTEESRIDNPSSLYGATKSINEILASSFANNFKLNITCVRLFSVYGPWGRPDMAIYKFTNAIIKDKPITLFNEGEMYRSFTFIDDVVEGLRRIILKDQDKELNPERKFKIYNLGSPIQYKINDVLKRLEIILNKKSHIVNCDNTYKEPLSNEGNMALFLKDFNFSCRTSLDDGLKKFLDWYFEYYKNNQVKNQI